MQQLSAEELARAILDGNVSLSQLDSFCTDVDVDAQKILTAELDIPEDVLRRTARAPAEHTREDLPLLAT